MSKPRPSMEFLFPTSFRTPRHFSLCCPFKLAINGRFSSRSRFRRRWDRVAKRPLRVALALERSFSFGEDRNAACARDEAGFCEDSECLEVIGIGSRRDAVLDFCLDSPFQSTSLRFWNILQEDSSKVILQQRFLGKDINPRVVEAPLSLQSCSKAIILVAGAAYGSDHITAIEIVKKTRTAKGLAVAIVLKPFSFEGQRRQDEVMYMVGKLQEHTNFYIVIDMDRLLQKDLVTLDEALRTAKNAVLLSLNAIAVLISRKHQKFIDVPHDNMRELEISHIIDIMECYTEAKVGFGVGYSIKSSIVQAIYDCPFLSVGIKDLNGTIICVLASSGVINSTDVNAFLQTFRQTTNCSSEIVISTIEEPNLEPNLIISTVFILGCIGQPASQKRSIFARLAHHFPFVVNFLGKNDQETKRTQGNHYRENSYVSNETSLSDSVEMPKSFFEGGRGEGFTCSEEHQEPQTLSSSNNSQVDALRSNVGISEYQYELSNFYDQNIEAFQREPLISWNLGPGHQIAQEWAKERETNADSTPVLDNPTVCPLPVGVRQSEELKDGSDLSTTTKHLKQISGDDMTARSPVIPRASPRNTLTDFSFEAVFDFCNSASTLLKKNYPDALKKQRVLSARAASMLEAERDSGKRWSPIVEIEYRGGVYRGRCQGGVPEGKGRLSLGDGGIYDGMWHSGKRAGLGIFYYSNGDVFQGSWRDDVVHGKGWFYFHSGDRWFANFWKGKANGEGRFYSKAGDVFFGHFQDGWRHGRFLCINVDGVRFVEIWDGGVLVSRKQLDLDAKSGDD